MTTNIIITFCALLLMAYAFDLSASRTKIPSVILLLLSGWLVRQAVTWLGIHLPDFTPLLPVLGTVGLILIVLEGSLELEFNRSKLPLVKASFWGALIPMLTLAFLLAFAFRQYGLYDFKDSLTNAIPLCVISSAIAIPSVRQLTSRNKEFIIYESSLSDILGVLFFNFLTLNEIIDGLSFAQFALQLVIMAIVSMLAIFVLSYLLNRIEHHIKFIPIILIVVLIYAVTKIYHLPGLIFILLFGVFVSNIDELKQFKWIEKFKPDELKKEVGKFREITSEGAFLIRALFFLLFGYLIESTEVTNPRTFVWAFGITLCIFIFRTFQLKLSKLPIQPLMYVAPRGLITILLFLSIDPAHTIPLVNKSLIIQVILLCALFMMLGLMTHRPGKRLRESARKPESETPPSGKSAV